MEFDVSVMFPDPSDEAVRVLPAIIAPTATSAAEEPSIVSRVAYTLIL